MRESQAELTYHGKIVPLSINSFCAYVETREDGKFINQVRVIPPTFKTRKQAGRAIDKRIKQLEGVV